MQIDTRYSKSRAKVGGSAHEEQDWKDYRRKSEVINDKLKVKGRWKARLKEKTLEGLGNIIENRKKLTPKLGNQLSSFL